MKKGLYCTLLTKDKLISLKSMIKKVEKIKKNWVFYTKEKHLKEFLNSRNCHSLYIYDKIYCLSLPSHDSLLPLTSFLSRTPSLLQFFLFTFLSSLSFNSSTSPTNLLHLKDYLSITPLFLSYFNAKFIEISSTLFLHYISAVLHIIIFFFSI